jgi:DNA-binding beta-propeller fold protein YncE
MVGGTPGNMDGFGTAAKISRPAGIHFGGGTLYLCDYDNGEIRAIDLASTYVSTVAAVPAPRDLAIGKDGRLYITSQNNTIYAYDLASHELHALWGQPGVAGSADGIGEQAQFRGPTGIVDDRQGHLYVADTDNQTIRKIDLSSGAVTTYAGTAGMSGFADGAVGAALFHQPDRMVIDAYGVIYVADRANHLVRAIDTTAGTVATVVGQRPNIGTLTGPLPGALSGPGGLALLPTGELVIVNSNENVVLLAH